MAGSKSFVPNKTLAVVSALAKGYSAYAKNIEEAEAQKQSQQAEMLKIILPEYMRMQASATAFERERPFKVEAQSFKRDELAQKGQLGIAGLRVDIAGLENAWNIANMQELGETERADAKNALDVQLKNIDSLIQGMIEQNKASIAGAGVASKEKISGLEIISAEKQTTEMVAGRQDTANIAKEAAQNRVDALIKSDERISQWKMASDKAIQEMKQKADTFPKALSEQVDKYQAETGLAAAIWAMALDNPDYAEVANIMQAQIMKSSTALNQALAEQGGTPLPGIVLPELTTEKTGLGIPLISPRGEKTVPVIPGVTPAPQLQQGLVGPQPEQQLPALKTSGVEFDKFVNMGITAGWTTVSDADKAKFIEMGIDPDAIEKAITEAKRERK